MKKPQPIADSAVRLWRGEEAIGYAILGSSFFHNPAVAKPAIVPVILIALSTNM